MIRFYHKIPIMLIDTHAHINFVGYKDDGDVVVKRALENDVWIINSGSERDTSRRAIEYADRYPNGVFASVGLQPIHLRDLDFKETIGEEIIDFKTDKQDFDYVYYRNLAQDKKVVAIGEAGLEHSHLDNETPGEQKKIKDKQQEVFLKHLELAKELDKPVIVHCRGAHNETIEILKNFISDTGYALKGTIHSFLGRWSQAEKYLEMGFCLSFNGVVTFARDYDKVIKNTPLERILLETDCPYLTPIPFRGKRNEPLYVKYVAEKIAEIRGISFDEVAKVTTENARKLFKI